MEPSTKKRKLAPKIPNPNPSSPSAINSHVGSHSITGAASYAADSDAATTAAAAAALASSSERHDFESFARHLQDAAMLIQRQAERQNDHFAHGTVSVMLLRWADDPTSAADIDALEHTFKNQYNYHTHRWLIPSDPNPTLRLVQHLTAFLESAPRHHLLVLYYAGFGFLRSDDQLYWASNARNDAAKIKWDGIRCLLEDTLQDVLLLLDTCALPDPVISGRHGTKQGIAACTPEHINREEGRSFTSFLNDALKKLGNGRPFSVQRLLEEIHGQKQHQLNSENPKSVNGNASNATTTPRPFFFTLTRGIGQNLTLSPAGTHSPDTDNETKPLTQDVKLPQAEPRVGLRFDEARVLVCTTFVGEASPDMGFYNRWLQSPPTSAGNIIVEGDAQPWVKKVGDGKMQLEAREVAVNTPARTRADGQGLDKSYSPSITRNGITPKETRGFHAINTSPSSSFHTVKPKDEGQDTAEMQEAAEQLKALSHVRHRSDETSSSQPSTDRQRTTLPDSIPEVQRQEHIRPFRSPGDADAGAAEPHTSPSPKAKAPRRALPKQESRCNHCTHAPFKDSTALRKHILAAHTRPFPCAFSFAGCNSTFGSKNEWKRHIASQHLCLTYYRCSSCSKTTSEGKGNEFNRKDLFTQHLRRMHAPHDIRRALQKGEAKSEAEWDARVRELQQSCLVTRRRPPQHSACPKEGCGMTFDGSSAWDDWTEHVGRHMEKGEAQRLGVDELLTKWALEEGVIEEVGDGEYRLSTASSVGGGGAYGTAWPSERHAHARRRSSAATYNADKSPLEESAVEAATQAAADRMNVD